MTKVQTTTLQCNYLAVELQRKTQ